ncbi:unnamed protein product, partial [Litomosoides sigmodontis]
MTFSKYAKAHSHAPIHDKNVKAMFDLLDPLHNMIDRGATTLKEQSFKQ